MELAVFPPCVAEVSKSPRPTLKVESGKFLKGTNDLGPGQTSMAQGTRSIGPLIFGVLCLGINDDCRILTSGRFRAVAGVRWRPSAPSGRLLDTLPAPPRANTSHGEPDHPSQSGHVGHLRHGKGRASTSFMRANSWGN